MTRRGFLQGSAALGAAFVASGCSQQGSNTTTDTAASTDQATDQATSDGATADTFKVVFGATTTDAGQYVDRMTIDFGDLKVTGIEPETFVVNMTSTVAYGEDEGKPYAYFDAATPLEVVKVDGDTIYFRQDQAPTLTWLAELRNYPATLGFTVKQSHELTGTTPDGRELTFTGTYECEQTSATDLVDPEFAAFEGVEDTINYQFHKGTNDKLIVWFHGNGEGDLPEKATGNNVTQILGNRGGAAWVSEAQDVFGDASVIAFQAPNMWYFAVKDGLLEPCYDEIQKVIKDNGIDPEEVYLSGCSAGGFMCTRMLIAYPDLFKAAMINCPALDAANARTETNDACPTDEELAQLKDAKTRIWLVQGETDSSVDPELCAKRIWSILTDGVDVTETEVEGTEGIASGFTTYETADGRYKMSLYKTVDLAEVEGISGEKRQGGKLVFAEDYDMDGKLEEVKYSDHWSWVYTLRNNPEAADGTHIWEWALGK